MLPGQVVYRDIVTFAEAHRSSFESLSVAEPLLPDRRVFAVMAREITQVVADNALTSWGVLLVGHGTREEGARRIYEASLRQARGVFPPAVPVELGHMEFSPPFAKDCLATLLLSGVKHLIIQPFMIVDGVHIDEVRKGLDVHAGPHSWHRELSEAYGEILRTRLLDFEFTFMPALGCYGGVFDIFFDHALRAQSPMV
jgi:sirohydrochlorin ferrochelatase